MPPVYYEKAMHLITAQVGALMLYIFYDKPDWGRQHMQFDVPAVYVVRNHNQHSLEDLRSMRLRNHIIANGSFSWCVAWLNANLDKMVVVPCKWIQTKSVDSPDLIPAR